MPAVLSATVEATTRAAADTTGRMVGATAGAAEEVSWYDVPGVQVLGMVVGGLLLLAAIRSMFGGRR